MLNKTPEGLEWDSLLTPFDHVDPWRASTWYICLPLDGAGVLTAEIPVLCMLRS